MRHAIKFNLVMTTLIGVVTFMNAQTKTMMQTTQWTADQQAVMNAIETMGSYFPTKDLEKIVACYESNATVIFEPQQATSDQALIRQKFEKVLASSSKFTFGEHEIWIEGDIALHTAVWDMEATTPDGNIIKDRGLTVAVLRRQEDGSWLFVIDNPHGGYLLKK